MFSKALNNKYKRDLLFTNQPEHGTAAYFVYQYGLFNCTYLILKQKKEVIEALKNDRDIDYDNDIEEKDKETLSELFGKEVVAYIPNRYSDNPDIFIFPGDNIPFCLSCFD